MFDASRPMPKKFDLQAGIRQLRVERHMATYNWCGETYDLKTDGWCIWLMANATFSIGTYLLLRDDGRIARVTISADGVEHVFEYE